MNRKNLEYGACSAAAQVEAKPGANPMSIADAVIREVHGDEEMLVDIIYFIIAFTNRYGETTRVLYEESKNTVKE